MLQRLDGNGIMLSAYNQHANISHNTIVQTGATAIALWGNSSGTHSAQPFGTGPDGTGGNFPRHTLVAGNFIRQLGIHSKQSACFFQAKSAQTTVEQNICFDVPRAGFNINDGFGGGNNITGNLLFQTCGESGDHGAINTWDRQGFITDVATGQPSFIPAVTEIHRNFIVSDGDADGGAVDNDDGSSHYLIHHNFAVYGGAKINNIGGHAQTIHSNVFAFPQVYGPSCLWQNGFVKPGQEAQMYENTCILTPGTHYIYLANSASCNFGYQQTFAPYIRTHHNRVFVANHNISTQGIVAGCPLPPPPPPPQNLRPLSDCSEIFVNTSLSGWYENDVRGLYGVPAASAEECRTLCARNSMCSSGEWYLSEVSPGPTQPGTPPRNQTMLCYLFHLPATVGPLNQTVGYSAFSCAKGLVPYAPGTDYGLDFETWMRMGLDEGTTVDEIPSVPDIIDMGMSVLIPIVQHNNE